MDFTKYIFKLRGTEMEAICFEEIGENIGGYIKNIIILNRKVSSNIQLSPEENRFIMSKSKKWCSHPVRHCGTSKVGRVPSHPTGKYRASFELVKFMQKEYGLPIIGLSKSNMENIYICNSCYEYEIDRFQNSQKSPMDQQLLNITNESQEDFQLRSSMDSLRMQDDFELGVAGKNSEYEKSNSSSEDEAVVLHEQNRIKKILNDVFRILEIPMVTDM